MRWLIRRAALVTFALFATLVPARASDHGDSVVINGVTRTEGDLTDIYAFKHGDNLVLILDSNSGLAQGMTSYMFPQDLTLSVYIDNDSEIRFADPDDAADPDGVFDLKSYGGTIVDKDHVAEDITFEFSFDENGEPSLRLKGLPKEAKELIRVETGVFDEPFISVNANSRLRNIAAIVMEMPLSLVNGGRDDAALLVWADSRFDDFDGPRFDHLGRALWGAVTGIDINSLPPRHHFKATGKPPDVVIFNLAKDALYPNGRLIEDDVRKGDSEVKNRSCNPVPHDFPYLAEPNAAGCSALP